MTYLPKGQATVYIRLSKAFCGILRAALLFYKRLRSDLKDMGFEVSPYNPCVAEKTLVNRHQTTVYWHMDDLKVSLLL